MTIGSFLRSARRHPGRLSLTAAAVLALVGSLLSAGPGPAEAATTLLSQGKPAIATSNGGPEFQPSAAVDGDTSTRWASTPGPFQWLRVDLGSTASISQVVLDWESSLYATSFQVQTSPNGLSWATIFSTTTGSEGTRTLDVTGTGRFVRMIATAGATTLGYSLREFQVFGTPVPNPSPTVCGTVDAALHHVATASTLESDLFPASAAVDGNPNTRWSSNFKEPQWIQVDLGAVLPICRVMIDWEIAYASAFQIQTSNDATTWTTIFSTTTGPGGLQTLSVNGAGRYLRMNGTVRATPFGISLWALVVNTINDVTGPI